jgi:outer membrane protein TolC
MKKISLMFLLFLCPFYKAQDTLYQIDLESFILQVRENHPLSFIARNYILQAEQFTITSKGAFDPQAVAQINQKYYDGKTYYSTLSTGVKIPTRFGVQFKGMVDWNRGEYLSPEDVTPTNGLGLLGVEVQLGRGLLTDEQRTQLKRAQNALLMSEVERNIALNDLLYEAGADFISWQESYNQMLLAQDMAGFAKNRFDQIKEKVFAEDRPAIDTVEALAIYTQRLFELNQKTVLEQNARLKVESYLWDQGLAPLFFDSNVNPAVLTIQQITITQAAELDETPLLQAYDYKLTDLNYERKLKIEQLKPQLSLNYNFLQDAQSPLSNYSLNNYKWGGTFYMPIFLRKERSSLEITKLKIENTKYEQQLKQRELNIKQQQLFNEWAAQIEQSSQLETISESYKQLVEGEQDLFDLGESTVFLINMREINYINAKMKLLETQAKTIKSYLSVRYLQGGFTR